MFSLYQCTWRKKDTWFVHWPFSVSQNVCNVTSRDRETVVKCIFLRCLALGMETFCNKNGRSVIIFIGKVLKRCVCVKNMLLTCEGYFYLYGMSRMLGMLGVFSGIQWLLFQARKCIHSYPFAFKRKKCVCACVCAHMCACLYAHAWVSVTDGYSHDSIIQSR